MPVREVIKRLTLKQAELQEDAFQLQFRGDKENANRLRAKADGVALALKELHTLEEE